MLARWLWVVLFACGGRGAAGPLSTGTAVLAIGEGRVMMGKEQVLVLHADGSLQFADQPEGMRLVVSRDGLVEITVRTSAGDERSSLIQLVPGGGKVDGKLVDELVVRDDRVRLTFEGTTTTSSLGSDGVVTVEPAPETLQTPLRVLSPDPLVRRTLLYLMTAVPYANYMRQQKPKS